MELKRTSHAVYDTKYHLVWTPKYRKWILRGDLRDFVDQFFREVAKNHDFEIEEMEIAEDHIHIFLGFPPKYSISEVVKRLKGASARAIFKMYPEVKRELWGGEFWEDGYFARTVGDQMTRDVIEKYIKHHQDLKQGPAQLDLGLR